MRLACGVLSALLLAATVFPQSRLTIDRLNRQDIQTIAQEVSYSTLLEGTVEDPGLAVYVLVYEPGIGGWKTYPATVDETHVDEAGGYRWRAICHFGEYGGQGAGLSYKVRVIAIEPERIKPGNLLDSLQAVRLQSSDLTIKRVKR